MTLPLGLMERLIGRGKEYGGYSRPQHVHDCDRCQFLGRYYHKNSDWGGRHFDLYFCPHPHIGQYPRRFSIIARYGSAEHAYLSTPYNPHSCDNRDYWDCMASETDPGPLYRAYERMLNL